MTSTPADTPKTPHSLFTTAALTRKTNRPACSWIRRAELHSWAGTLSPVYVHDGYRS